jgi:hypothetical protein
MNAPVPELVLILAGVAMADAALGKADNADLHRSTNSARSKCEQDQAPAELFLEAAGFIIYMQAVGANHQKQTRCRQHVRISAMLVAAIRSVLAGWESAGSQLMLD